MTIEELLEQDTLFYNWRTNTFENDFSIDAHVNEDYRHEQWDTILHAAESNQAEIATVCDYGNLILKPGVRISNRFGYVVYKNIELDINSEYEI